MFPQLTQSRLRDPCIGEEHVLAFPRVGEKIIDTRHSVRARLTEDRVQLLEVHFPVAPLDSKNIIAHVDDYALTVGLFLFAEEEVGLVYPIDDTVCGHLSACNSSECGEEIHLVDDFIAAGAGRDLPRPPDGERNSEAAFETGEQGAAPGTGRSWSGSID